ncbi:glycoside hydrolase family 2 protein [Bacillus sp. USDA818B3_A]|uniref:glycoside hydrolase family 2 protein n=1 Tax=Bacillus sp. USDA818B3_A TaxID=2698834 RepID=UPI00137221F3|nr:glycoside hydrolase family 2 TIM barrel-domain containing protein [Bacillus sp. USDA818B3_A]
MFWINLKKSSLVMLGILLLFSLAIPSANAEQGNKAAAYNIGRFVMNINQDWTFHKGAQGTDENYSAINFNDSSWQKISLPHTWNAEDGSGIEENYKGDGWYRKELDIPASYEGKKVYLQFEAANKEAEVFVNGKSVHTHIGGYSAFIVDITDYVNYGQKNTVAVRVNNEVKDSAPLRGDFTFWGGIYRSVNLLVTDKTHIDVDDYGSNGVYVTIPNDKSIEKNAEVTLSVPVKVNNDDLKSIFNSIEVRAEIKDAEGKVRARTELKTDGKKLKSANVSGDIAQYTGKMIVNNPHLWNGTKDPYQYTVEVAVARKGEVIDQVNEKVGFRYYSIDPNKGFFLNGKSYPLHGVDLHQDRKGYGNAVPYSVRAEDFDLIKEIGANTLRLAHYEHSQYDYDKADEMGLVVWAEMPLVNAMTSTKEFSDNAETQLTELIKQNYNHPSIVTWGLENEFGGSGSYMSNTSLTPDEQYAKATELINRLATKAKELDPNRLTTHAIQGNNSRDPEGYKEVLDRHLAWNESGSIDVASFNTYFGWYYNKAGDLANYLDTLHEKHPNVPLGISEYGGGANPYQHDVIDEDFINNWNSAASRGPWQPEEYQNYLHESAWSIISERPWLWATHVWNMFDFGVAGKNEASTPGINTKGLVSYDRQVKKDAFYFYKAQWNKDDQFVYVTSRRYTDRDETITPVKVYSNLKEVTLTVNGKDYGKGRLQQPGVFVWDGVELKDSGNLVIASAKKADGTNVTDSVTTWKVVK